MQKNMLLIKALSETIHLNPNEKFTVKKLFKGYEWSRMEKKKRRILGEEMREYIKSDDNEYPIVLAGKTKSGRQNYRIENISYSFSNNSSEDDDDYDYEK